MHLTRRARTTALALAACTAACTAAGCAAGQHADAPPRAVHGVEPAAFHETRDGVRLTVVRLGAAAGARERADRMLAEADQTHRSLIACDLRRPITHVAGVPTARGVVIDHRTASGTTVERATIVFTYGPRAYRVTAMSRSGNVSIPRLERTARTALRHGGSAF